MTSPQDLLLELKDEEIMKIVKFSIDILTKMKQGEGKMFPPGDATLLKKLAEIRYLLNTKGVF